MTTSNEGERMSRILNGTFRRGNLILLTFLFFGVAIAQAQDSLEGLQKRKTIAEAEKAAIEAEMARDEARKKYNELSAPLDPAQKAKDDTVDAAYSTNTIADPKNAGSKAPSLCVQCLEAAQEELKKCLAAAISQEDKRSCLEKKDTRVKRCDTGECKIERAQSGRKDDESPEKK
ncbi:MAG: hypothetical protein ABI955_11885 [Nitrospirota bacterium]